MLCLIRPYVAIHHALTPCSLSVLVNSCTTTLPLPLLSLSLSLSLQMESLVGRSVVVQVRGQLQPAVIRASTDCLSLSSDFSQVKVSRHDYCVCVCVGGREG